MFKIQMQEKAMVHTTKSSALAASFFHQAVKQARHERVSLLEKINGRWEEIIAYIPDFNQAQPILVKHHDR